MADKVGRVRAKPGFLEPRGTLCDGHGALLSFDEVFTGCRMAYGGAQAYLNITPDLTTFGKIIGGGLPVGAYGGKREYMERIAPAGNVYQAGTLSGNPLAMAAGLATLRVLRQSDYAGLEARTKAFAAEMESILRGKGIAARVHQIGTMFCPFFTTEEVWDFDAVKRTDAALFTRFYKAMRAKGIYLAPASFEAGMMSFVHTDQHLERTLEAVKSLSL